MDNGKKVGIIIIIAIIISICISAYAGYINNEATTNTTQKLNKNSLNLDENFTPEVINININQTGSYLINFTDSEDIATITSQKGDNTQSLNVTNNQDGQNLNIDINSDTDDNVILLSNKYKYNINCKSVIGGYAVDLPTNAHVETLTTTVGIGGVAVNLNGGVINNIQNQITIGGVAIEGNTTGLVNVNSTIAVGGLQIDVNDPLSIHSDILFGGSQLNKTETNNTTVDFTDSNYNSAENRMNINSNIQIGGIKA